MPPNTVKVDRSTPWGNPFITGQHGTQARCVTLYVHLLGGLLCISVDRECALRQKLAHEHVDQHLDELRGKHLACWCQIGKPCHADILLILANNPKDVASERILEMMKGWGA